MSTCVQSSMNFKREKVLFMTETTTLANDDGLLCRTIPNHTAVPIEPEIAISKTFRKLCKLPTFEK